MEVLVLYKTVDFSYKSPLSISCHVLLDLTYGREQYLDRRVGEQCAV